VINVPNSKTGKGYAVQMDEDVMEVLLGLRRRGGLCLRQPRDRRALRRSEEVVRHGLSFGTGTAEYGCSEATIAAMMKHSDPPTARRYAHATGRARHAAVSGREGRALEGVPHSCHRSEKAAEVGRRKRLG
jgi:hypothetical protein